MAVEHVDIPIAEIHIIHNYVYADAAARTGASGFAASDVGRVAKQSDNNSYWVLTATTPTWAELTNTSVGSGQTGTVNVFFDGGSSAIAAGTKLYFQVDFAGVINSATLLADQTGSIVVDIWKDTYANAPPTVADTITASAKPTLSSAQKAQDTTLTGWTTSFAAGDIFICNVDSATTVTKVLLALKVTRS